MRNDLLSVSLSPEFLIGALPDKEKGELQWAFDQLDDPNEELAHLKNATVYSALSGDDFNSVYNYTDAINETLYGTASETSAIENTNKTREGVRITLSEKLANFNIIDALEMIPFSSVYQYKKKFYDIMKGKEETGKYPVRSALGLGMRIYDWLGILDISQAQREDYIQSYEDTLARGQTIPATIFDGVTMLPAYMIEFALGGAAAKSIGLATTGVKGAFAASLVRTALQPERVASALIDQRNKKGQGPATSLFKAYGDVYIENLSETAGGAVVPILKKMPFGSKLLGALTRLGQKAGMSKLAVLEKISTKAGWNGFVGEWGEERLASQLKAIFDIDDFGTGPNSTIPDRMAAAFLADMTLSNQLAEAGVLSFPFATKMIAAKIIGSEAIEIEQLPKRTVTEPTGAIEKPSGVAQVVETPPGAAVTAPQGETLNVTHSANEPIESFQLGKARPNQLEGVYFSKEGARTWGPRKYVYDVELKDVRLAPPEIAKEVSLDEMGKGKDWGHRAAERLKTMGYDGADLGENELVVWNTDKIGKPTTPPTEMAVPAKAEPPTRAMAEELETREEAQLAETELQAEAAEIIKPKLYIGNVTPGMKARIADAMDWTTKDIEGFKEKGWPTNRTEVEMTKGEAEEYLEWLEKDLQRRLDKDLIHTRHEMAMANADWGDIAALRKVLGIEKGQRPWLIKQVEEQPLYDKEGKITGYKETPGYQEGLVTSRDALNKAYKELRALEKDLRNPKLTPEQREEIETAIEAQENLIMQMEEATGRTAKILKTTGAVIAGATHPSSIQESKMTVGEVLSAVMKRGARFAKMAYAGGRKELRADIRAKARAKARIKKAVKAIGRKIPKTVDFFYREAIEALRSNVDLKHRNETTLASRKATREFLQRVPADQRDVPIDVIKKAISKPLNDFTVEELEQIANEVQTLVQQGKLKRRLLQRPIIEQRKKDIADLTANTIAAHKPNRNPGIIVSSTETGGAGAAIQKGKLWTWVPASIFDMLDGNKNFSGRWHRIFYDDLKDRKAKGLNGKNNTFRALKNERKRLSLSLWDLASSRDIKGIKYTSQEIMGIYMAAQNPLSKLHLVYGRQMTENAIKNVIEGMSANEKALADWMLDWYDKNYPEMRRAVIEQENRDPGQQDKYSPIAPVDTTWKGLQQEIRAMFEQRAQLRTHNVAHGFTLERKDVPDWMRSKARIDAVNMFMDAVQKHYRYVHLGPQIRRMRKILANHELRKVLSDRFGVEMLKILDGYVSSAANPYIYRQHSWPERISAKARQNSAIVYLCWNATTMLKQPAAILFYLPDAGPAHLIASLAEFTQHPLEMIERVRALDPEVAELSMERELEELKAGKNANLVRRAVTDAGFEGMYLFDSIARTIGWNAVWQRAKAEGKSDKEAVRLARDATLRTQNAASPEDIPAIYRTDEWLNWFSIFTNQQNKMFNIATKHIPSYMKNKEYAKAALAAMGLALNALIMWMIWTRRLPDKPEDVIEALGGEAIEMIPLLGKPIMDGLTGWPTDVPIFAGPRAVGVAGKAAIRGVTKDKWDLSRKEVKDIALGISIAGGLPYTGIVRLVEAMQYGEPSRILGAPLKTKKKPTSAF